MWHEILQILLNIQSPPPRTPTRSQWRNLPALSPLRMSRRTWRIMLTLRRRVLSTRRSPRIHQSLQLIYRQPWRWGWSRCWIHSWDGMRQGALPRRRSLVKSSWTEVGQWGHCNTVNPYHTEFILGIVNYVCSADSRLAPSQWETALLCNDVSHWLGASLESALICLFCHFLILIWHG